MIKLGSRNRSSFETLTQYHKRLKAEALAIKQHLRGRMFYLSRAYYTDSTTRGQMTRTSPPFRRPKE